MSLILSLLWPPASKCMLEFPSHNLKHQSTYLYSWVVCSTSCVVSSWVNQCKLPLPERLQVVTKSKCFLNINASTLRSVNTTTVLKYILVNPIWNYQSCKRFNLPHFLVSFLFAKACYAVSLLCLSPSPYEFFCRLFERILVTNANKRLRGVPENPNVLE